MRFLTMFYTGIGRLYNLSREEFGRGHGVRDIPRLAAHILTLYTIPFVIGSLITNRYLGPDDDDDSFFWWLGKGSLGEMIRPLVGLDWLWKAADRASNGKFRGMELSELEDTFGALLARISKQGDKDWGGVARDATELAGALFGFPTKQVLTTYRGAISAMDKWSQRNALEKAALTPFEILMGPGRRPKRKK